MWCDDLMWKQELFEASLSQALQAEQTWREGKHWANEVADRGWMDGWMDVDSAGYRRTDSVDWRTSSLKALRSSPGIFVRRWAPAVGTWQITGFHWPVSNVGFTMPFSSMHVNEHAKWIDRGLFQSSNCLFIHPEKDTEWFHKREHAVFIHAREWTWCKIDRQRFIRSSNCLFVHPEKSNWGGSQFFNFFTLTLKGPWLCSH